MRAVINSFLCGGVQGRWCEVVLQQVEATAEHMPSGNRAALLYRDSGVIISQSLLLLGLGGSHKHHLPEEAAAHLSAGRGAGATRPLKNTKGSASSHCLMSIMQLSLTSTRSSKSRSDRAELQNRFPFAEETPKVFEAKLVFQRQ